MRYTHEENVRENSALTISSVKRVVLIFFWRNLVAENVDKPCSLMRQQDVKKSTPQMTDACHMDDEDDDDNDDDDDDANDDDDDDDADDDADDDDDDDDDDDCFPKIQFPFPEALK